jgi:DNA-binding MarR family transcriptional regulator
VLLMRPTSIGRLGSILNISRQAARKLVDSLEQRGYVETERDLRDGRALNVVLTPTGSSYAGAIVEAVEEINGELCGRVDPADLVAADRVLRAAIFLEADRERAANLVSHPPLRICRSKSGPGNDSDGAHE